MERVLRRSDNGAIYAQKCNYVLKTADRNETSARDNAYYIQLKIIRLTCTTGLQTESNAILQSVKGAEI